MKRLAESKALAGQLETISMMDLRSSPGDVIKQIQMGKTYVLTHAGKPVAVLQPLPGERLAIIIDSEGKVSYAP